MTIYINTKTSNRNVKDPLPNHLWKRNDKGKVICRCGKGYGSEYDGLCLSCRGSADDKIKWDKTK